METKELNKQEYLLRINKVTDYIHNNIDQPLPLQKMAGIACFSPFHFHRVFTILTGETPTDYIKRTRIEKAARCEGAYISNAKRIFPGLIITESTLEA